MSDWKDDPGLYVSETPGGWYAVYLTPPVSAKCYGTMCQHISNCPVAAASGAMSLAVRGCSCFHCKNPFVEDPRSTHGMRIAQ